MSFWKTAGDLAKKAGSAALDGAKNVNERNKQYKSEMMELSDSELASIVKRDMRSSPMKATAAMGELKSRGYSAEDVKNM